jgi:hypothetical protein
MKLSKQFQAYESDFSKFLKDMKQKNPEIERGQREGRAIWWDRPPIDLDARERTRESAVKQQPYVYQTKF